MICIKNPPREDANPLALSAMLMEFTDEDGKPYTGIRSIDVHFRVDGIVTADVEMLCSEFDVCAVDRVKRICPRFGIEIPIEWKKIETVEEAEEFLTEMAIVMEAEGY